MKHLISCDCCVTLKMRLKVVIVWFVIVLWCCAYKCNREIVITLMLCGVVGWTLVLRWFNNTLIVQSQCHREWVTRSRIKEPCVGSDPPWSTVIHRDCNGSRPWSILDYGGSCMIYYSTWSAHRDLPWSTARWLLDLYTVLTRCRIWLTLVPCLQGVCDDPDVMY